MTTFCLSFFVADFLTWLLTLDCSVLTSRNPNRVNFVNGVQSIVLPLETTTTAKIIMKLGMEVIPPERRG